MQRAHLLGLYPFLNLPAAVHIEQLGNHLARVAVALRLGYLVVVELVLHNHAQHRVHLVAHGLVRQQVLLLLLPCVGLQQQRHRAVVGQHGLHLALGNALLALQHTVKAVEYLDERPLGDASCRGHRHAQRFAPRTHRRLDYVHQHLHVALAVGVGCRTELVLQAELGKPSILELAACRHGSDARCGNLAVLVAPRCQALGQTEAVLRVESAQQVFDATEDDFRLILRVGTAEALHVVVLEQHELHADEATESRLVNLSGTRQREVGAQSAIVPDGAVLLALRAQQLGLRAGGHLRVNPCVEAVDAGEGEHLERCPAIHLTASNAGAFQSAADVPPHAAVLPPLALAQSDHRLHLLRVEVVGVEAPQELCRAQQLVEPVPVLRVILASRRVLQQVLEIHTQSHVDCLADVLHAPVSALQQVNRPLLLLLLFGHNDVRCYRLKSLPTTNGDGSL